MFNQIAENILFLMLNMETRLREKRVWESMDKKKNVKIVLYSQLFSKDHIVATLWYSCDPCLQLKSFF